MKTKIVTILKDIGQGAIWPFDHLTKVIVGISAALKAEPAVKAAIIGLLTKIQVLAADAAAAAEMDGLSISRDEATAAAAATLFTYVKDTFIPEMEAAYKSIVLTPSTPGATSATVTVTETPEWHHRSVTSS